MSMDWYYEQLERTSPLTESTLNDRKRKTYSSGRQMNVGDIVFEGYLKDESGVSPITFHYDELNVIYRVLDFTPTEALGYPVLRFIR